MNFDKPYHSTSELIHLLESRGIIIDDPDFAATAIESHSYYTIVNGYKNRFLSPDGKAYAPGVKFSDLYNMHMIDTGLSSILFKYILFAERELKNRISQLIASKYGVFTDVSDKSNCSRNDYLCRYYYHNCRRRNNILLRLKNSMDPSINHYCNDIVLHYRQHHNHIPPWIMATNIPFGLAIEWYYILSPNDKKSICTQMLPTDSLISDENQKEFFLAALRILKKYRNDIAHGYRVCNCIVSTQLPKEQALHYSCGTISEKDYSDGYGANDLYAISIILYSILGDPIVLKDYYRDISNFVLNYNGMVLAGHTFTDVLHIPADFMMRLNNLHKKALAAKDK